MAIIAQSVRSLPSTSGAPSVRTLATSFGLHLLTLGSLLLVPAGALRHSARLQEVDVVFHRPQPRVEIAASGRPALPPGDAPAVLAGPERIGPPAPSRAIPEPGPSAPGDPLAPAFPSIPPDPGGIPVTEAPPKKRVDQSGILAFRGEFASLTQEKAEPRLGRQARYGEADDAGRGASRSSLVGQGPGSSGGIDVASLSRGVGGGGGGGRGGGGGGGGDAVQGLPVGRATSPIASIGGGERPLAHGGPGLSRTDEEIQIVFDRYKASFYRLYNRELRRDPTLRGQMVLKLTIEPDGSVSMCVLQSTDMNAPELSDQVVNRVRTINFGAKDVQALTIVYPIDFLPAA